MDVLMRLTGEDMLTSYACATYENLPAAVREARGRFTNHRQLQCVELSSAGNVICIVKRDGCDERCSRLGGPALCARALRAPPA